MAGLFWYIPMKRKQIKVIVTLRDKGKQGEQIVFTGNYPNKFERHIIYNLQLLPRPSGVLIDYRESPPAGIFGFSGTGFQPFNQGSFA